MNISKDTLLALVDPKSCANLEELGGIDSLISKLNSNRESGIDSSTIPTREVFFGCNKLPEAKRTSFLRFCFNALSDKTLVVLMVAAAIELAIGVYKYEFSSTGTRDPSELLDGIAVLAAGKFSIKFQ